MLCYLILINYRLHGAKGRELKEMTKRSPLFFCKKTSTVKTLDFLVKIPAVVFFAIETHKTSSKTKPYSLTTSLHMDEVFVHFNMVNLDSVQQTLMAHASSSLPRPLSPHWETADS